MLQHVSGIACCMVLPWGLVALHDMHDMHDMRVTGAVTSAIVAQGGVHVVLLGVALADWAGDPPTGVGCYMVGSGG